MTQPEALLPVAGLLFVAAITPGPNNLAVLSAAARGGTTGALPATAGIVLGSLALLSVVWFGGGALLDAHPMARRVLSVAGAAYLLWLGLRLYRSAGREVGACSEAAVSSMAGLLMFQFANPKGWVLMLTVSAAHPVGDHGGLAFAHLAILMSVVTGGCLLIWALAGAALTQHLGSTVNARRFGRSMGLLLAGSALSLLA